ncbi:MAG: 16S rRNA (adenine(1518)-N(6)/adenine(1519)-N(6))-dimethyltransferase RsmA [Oscillospiraceae bacterium]|nr:16S rRNA (adenine(1518)-N(6)/adenine(1519)-N(6))-dimethyltransferase RsmA [Oscillospiraceae bacterium]
MNLCNRSDVQALLARHGFRFSKSMGQNFLMDAAVPVRIAEAAGLSSSVGVLEIGPGIGALTVELTQRAGRVTAVELDRALLPLLAETLAPYPNTDVIHGNILQQDLRELIARVFPGLTPVVCANLPYNITSPVLTHLIEADCFRRITVMVQREVALRICAAPGTADYGAFSVYMQYHMQPELLFDVPPESFLPAPKVTSSVITMTPYETKPVSVQNETLFFRVVKAAFGQRRKTLPNALLAAFGGQLTKSDLQQILSACGLPLDIRGERLDLAAFAAVTEQIQSALSV